ncbi:P-loop NTPase [Actinopolymorpha cephalotaxi]|uniref:Mrp family chromosome partitioning ATPase n=1 Tax=Actinopolymorpha cephalotaxi TaxID=504797 RepID=A0ABX2RYK0_9ACTN|nr:P-loop NTPase [Actinopolymorpha cephalotaxi]NYH81222.1 Mrp family chromosome partitioning ATPase [Actinopolymorpha cephalotaxi]
MSSSLNRRGAVRAAGWPAGILVLTTGIGLAAAFALTIWVTPTYEARSSMTVAAYSPAPANTGRPAPADGTGIPAAGGYDPVLSQGAVATVARLAESARVAHLTAAQTGIPAGAVSGHLHASYQPGVQVVTLTGDARTSRRAAAIVNTAATVLRAQVASAGTFGSGTTLTVSPWDRAATSTTATPTNLPRNLLLGGVAGLLAGLVIVVVRRRTDSTLRSTDQIERELQVGILGTLPRVPDRHQRKGALGAWRRLRVARPVRSAVAALAPLTDIPDRRLLVTSAYQDDGKAFVSALISLALAEQYYRVTLVETDLHRPGVGPHFPGGGEYTVQQLMSKPEQLKSAQGPLRVVSADECDPELSRALLRSVAFRDFLTSTREHSDVLVLDGPPVLVGAGLSALAAECDAAVVVVRACSTGVAEARRAIQVLDRLQLPIAGIIVVDARDEGGRTRYRSGSAPTYAPAPAPLPDASPALSPALSPPAGTAVDTDEERYASTGDEADRLTRSGGAPDQPAQQDTEPATSR